jgi:hypothetical protein
MQAASKPVVFVGISTPLTWAATPTSTPAGKQLPFEDKDAAQR